MNGLIDNPSGGNLKKRLIGSTSPGTVSAKRRREMSVCVVRALDVSMPGFQFRT